ncbi:hypothetical protein B0J14DRAFT_556063 [Halenospora varia]|nr:hypothetical protein B0J14DRAFT_556063 [Halenospora varia]
MQELENDDYENTAKGTSEQPLDLRTILENLQPGENNACNERDDPFADPDSPISLSSITTSARDDPEDTVRVPVEYRDMNSDSGKVINIKFSTKRPDFGKLNATRIWREKDRVWLEVAVEVQIIWNLRDTPRTYSHKITSQQNFEDAFEIMMTRGFRDHFMVTYMVGDVPLDGPTTESTLDHLKAKEREEEEDKCSKMDILCSWLPGFAGRKRGQALEHE